MTYFELDEKFMPMIAGAWKEHQMTSELPPDMVCNVVIVNNSDYEVLAGVRSHGEKRLNRTVRLAAKGRVEASIRMHVKVYRDIFEYYSSQDDVEFHIAGYWDSWPPTHKGSPPEKEEEKEDEGSHFYRDCLLFDEENMPCQFMVDGECPHECEKYTDKVML